MDIQGKPARLQWSLTIAVWHSPQFGHSISCRSQTAGRDPKFDSLGTWRGLGVPEPVLNEARARIDSIFTEHLVTRYGVAGELPLKWSGEPDPF